MNIFSISQDVTNSACLGSAYRAKHGLLGGIYKEVIKGQNFTLACKPNSDADKVKYCIVFTCIWSGLMGLFIRSPLFVLKFSELAFTRGL